METKPLPSQEYLRSIFDYNFFGRLIWKRRSSHSPQWNGKHAGHQAGGRCGRCIHVVIDGEHYLAHRVIWKWMTGDDPPVDIDHRDGDALNNRWDNLRTATKDQNLRNSRLHSGKTLPKGVSLVATNSVRYRAAIYVNKRQRHLGCFDDPNDAHAAYRAAATRHFGEFARFE